MYGKKHPPEVIEKMKKPKSKEHIQKLREAKLKYWERIRQQYFEEMKQRIEAEKKIE